VSLDFPDFIEAMHGDNRITIITAQNDNLQIHEEKNKGVYVKGLSDFYVGDQADVYSIMKQGGMARAVSSTSE